MRVTKSRYTAGLENGKDVAFNIGEKVRYKMRNGKEYNIIIKSSYKKHTSGYFGYESLFPDGTISFTPDIGIIGWEGRVG